MTERSEIQFGLTPIPFVIRRSPKRATVALTIENDGRLVVTAPPAATIDALNKIVRHKAPWVVERIRLVSDLPPPPSGREFVTGETVLYLGRQFRLKVIESTEEHPRIWAGWYEVPIPAGLGGDDRAKEVRRKLVGSLKEHADLWLPYRLSDACERLGLQKPSLVVREQKKRWGSCDASGVLRINWRIIQAPVSLVEYVLVHELVHLQRREHGPEFWAALGRMMPGYEERRARLRKLGPSLEW